MTAQVHFLGIETTGSSVTACLLKRKGTVVASMREAITPFREEESTYVYDPKSWSRQVAEIAREVVESSGVPNFKIWGYTPVSFAGWVCLDIAGQPLSSLHVAKAIRQEAPFAEKIRDFLQSNNSARSHTGLILSPKDYFRFRWSKVIATDATSASTLGLAAGGESDWREAILSEYGFEKSWLPPIFPPSFACGRVGSEGAEAMGLQSSAWSAVGSTAILSRIAGCGRVNGQALYLFAEEPDSCHWFGTEETPEKFDPSLSSKGVFSARLDRDRPANIAPNVPLVLDWRENEDPEPLLARAKALNRPVFTAPFAGRISPGPAVLGALASGAFSATGSFYRRFFQRPQPLEH